MPTLWIDAHVHLFPANSAWETPRLPALRGAHDLSAYRAQYGEDAPKSSVVVHFSKAPDAGHVIDSLDEAKRADYPARGIIAANLDEPNLTRWLKRDDVAGVRFYGIVDKPDLETRKAEWNSLFNKLRHGKKHIAIYGKDELLWQTVQALPRDIPLLIDHLGVPDVSAGPGGHAFRRLLNWTKSRNQSAGAVYVKGPGYRTSILPEKAATYVQAWAEAVGESHILLGASDAPFPGPVSGIAPGKQSRNFADIVNHRWMRDYVERLAEVSGLKAQAVLHDNAARLYGF